MGYFGGYIGYAVNREGRVESDGTDKSVAPVFHRDVVAYLVSTLSLGYKKYDLYYPGTEGSQYLYVIVFPRWQAIDSVFPSASNETYKPVWTWHIVD